MTRPRIPARTRWPLLAALSAAVPATASVADAQTKTAPVSKKAFVASLRDAQARWKKTLEKLKGRPIVAYHRSLAYLSDWTGLVVVDHIESKPGVPPDPRHVAELIALARQKGARAVVQEAFHPTRTSELVASKLGGKLLRIPGATNFQGGQGYVAFLDQVLKRLVEGT